MAVTLALFALLAIAAPSASAQQQTFSSTGGVTIFQGGNASPYGTDAAAINVAGMAGHINYVTVTLDNVTLNSSNVDMMLVSPAGQGAMFSSDVPSNVTGKAWTFDDASGTAQPDNANSGTYAPRNVNPPSDSDLMTGAPPEFGYSLGQLSGDNPNGTWRLYVRDGGISNGSIGSWSIQITTITGVVSPSPAEKDFGSLLAGTSSAAQTITVQNTGNYSVVVGAPVLEGANPGDFSVLNNNCTGSGGMLGEGQSCSMAVRFRPTAGGARSAMLKIPATNDDAPASTPATGGSVALSGTGLAPAISIDPAALDFGTLVGTLHQPAAQKTVTITNSGTAPLSVAGASSLGGDAIQFSTDDRGCATLAPGASCTLLVSYIPQTYGTHSSQIVIEDNSPGAPHSIPVSGTFLAPPPGQQPAPKQGGSPDITVKSVQFQAPGSSTPSTPNVGQPTSMVITASDPKEQITGVIVDFGEKLGLYGASGCVNGKNKGGSATFEVPYTFLSAGSHTVKITIFAGGCGRPEAHTYEFVVSVGAKAARRAIARSSEVLAGPNITSACANKDVSPSSKNGKVILKALLCIMNEQRKLAKLGPLKVSKALQKAALAHTKAMVLGKFFAHQGPAEGSLGIRLKKAKYRGAAGENLGAGAGSLSTPLGMVNGWMHSSLHRANLLSRRWKTVGIGYVAKFPVPTAAQPVATFTTDFGVK